MQRILSLKKIKWQTWVLLFLFLVGVFFRSYHFHQWLFFGDDQIRDARISGDAAVGKTPWPLKGPFMSFSGISDHGEENSFHIGPIYYYFQILAAKIFGNHPEVFAYPDMFFGILSIPLLYIFLKRYFGDNVALAVASIYAVSSYFVSYSRFAWNTNLIPFFVLLLLLSLQVFLEEGEKVSWLWTMALGFAWGVGFQLHAITMVLFSVIVFGIFLFSLKKDWHIWKKWAAVLVIFLILNASQIFSEIHDHFANTKIFFQTAQLDSGAATSISANGIFKNFGKLRNDFNCHVEANFYLLSSHGNGQCSFDLINTPINTWNSHYFRNPMAIWEFCLLVVSLGFSLFGYAYLVYAINKEKKPQKRFFLSLILFYFLAGFLIMLPISKGDINDIRYYTFGFFIPFVFLGFLIEIILKKITKRFVCASSISIILGLLLISNLQGIYQQSRRFESRGITCSSLYKISLGELEPVVTYATTSLGVPKQIFLEKDSSHRVMPDALEYLFAQKNINLVRVGDKDALVPKDAARIFIGCRQPASLPLGTKLKVDDFNFDQKIGQIYVYPLTRTETN